MKIVKFTNSNDDTVIKQVHDEIYDGEWKYGDLDEVHFHDGKLVGKEYTKSDLEKLGKEVFEDYKSDESRIKLYLSEKALIQFNKALQNWTNNH